MRKLTTPIKTTLVLAGLLLGGTAFAQQGIGTNNPNPDAALDISTPTKGLLMPRVALTATNSPAPLSANVEGMTVYNTATAGTAPNDVTPGYYFNDGTQWVKVADASLVGTDPDITDDAWVDDPANSQVHLGTLSDGATTRPVGTEVVIKDDGKVGIGTATPSDQLDIFAAVRPKIAFSQGSELRKFRVGRFAVASAHMAENLDYTGSWNLDDVTANGAVLSVGGNIPLRFRVADAGINPVSPTTVFSVFPNGYALFGAGGTPTNNLHVIATANPLRLEGLQPGAATDNIMTVDANGVVTKTTTSLSAFDATNDAWVNNAANTRIELATLSDGTTARPVGTEVVIKDDGYMGIGTTTPGTRFIVSGNDASLLSGVIGTNLAGLPTDVNQPTGYISGISGGGNMQFYAYGPAATQNVDGVSMAGKVRIRTLAGASNTGFVLGTANATSPIHMYTNNQQRMVITPTGEIGVGLLAPTNRLHITAASNPLRLEGLQTGAAADMLLTSDATGVVRQVSMASVSSSSAIRTESANYAVAADDATILVNAAGGAVTVTLPAPVMGKKYVVKKIDASVNNMVIATSGGATIDGAATRTTSVPYQTFVLQNDGTNWFIIN